MYNEAISTDIENILCLKKRLIKKLSLDKLHLNNGKSLVDLKTPGRCHSGRHR
ncbi:hypothetical protein TPY_1978 [Sulfobacillus acidophilus TPY]|nr:hypothetical protein TPY_1978 [Sulfobacillus acidophilus TPY]